MKTVDVLMEYIDELIEENEELIEENERIKICFKNKYGDEYKINIPISLKNKPSYSTLTTLSDLFTIFYNSDFEKENRGENK